MLNIYKIKKLACAHRNEIMSLHNCILNQKIGLKTSYSALQKYSPPLNFSTFCHILTTNVNVFYWDFMW